MFSITKEFHFSASHQLDGLEPGHPCARLHGHNYIVRVMLQSCHLNDVGFVLDYGDLKPFGKFIDDFLDHRHLNHILTDESMVNPSAEVLAEYLHDVLRDTVSMPDFVRCSVGVSETPKTWAWFTPTDEECS